MAPWLTTNEIRSILAAWRETLRRAEESARRQIESLTDREIADLERSGVVSDEGMAAIRERVAAARARDA